jgi:hypothetical protein
VGTVRLFEHYQRPEHFSARRESQRPAHKPSNANRWATPCKTISRGEIGKCKTPQFVHNADILTKQKALLQLQLVGQLTVKVFQVKSETPSPIYLSNQRLLVNYN